MSVLRLTKMTPDIYSQESRDFQLLCRIYDCVINGIKWDGDSTIKSIDTHNCRSEMLELLQTKLGFFTTKSFTMDELRMALEAFPDLVKSKGSLKAILGAVNTFLHTLHISTPVEIWCTKEETTIGSHVLKDHTLIIGIQASISDTTLLKEIFRYILPTGYDFYIYYYSKVEQLDRYKLHDRANLLFISEEIENNIANEPQYELLEYVKKEAGTSAQGNGYVDLGEVNENYGLQLTYSMTAPTSAGAVNNVNAYAIQTGTGSSYPYISAHYFYSSSSNIPKLRYSFNATYAGSGTEHTLLDNSDDSVRISRVNFLNDGIAYYYNETTGEEFTETITKTAFSYSEGVVRLGFNGSANVSYTIYDIQVSCGDRVIYHFVPACDSDGYGGFYEVLNGFFNRVGTTTTYFTKGPSKGKVISPVIGQIDDIKIAPESTQNFTANPGTFRGIDSVLPTDPVRGDTAIKNTVLGSTNFYYCQTAGSFISSVYKFRGCYTNLSLVQNPANRDVVIIDNPNNNNYWYSLPSSSGTTLNQGKYRGAYASTSAVTNPTRGDIISIHKPTEIEWYTYNGSSWEQMTQIVYRSYNNRLIAAGALNIVRDYLVYVRGSSSWASLPTPYFTPPVYYPADWANGSVPNNVIAQDLASQLNETDEIEEEETE